MEIKKTDKMQEEFDKNFTEGMKKEALERMEFLNLHENVIREFNDERKLNKSLGSLGLLYHLDDEEKEYVKNWEENIDCIVYHAILSETTIGPMLSLLYVSKNEEEWEMDRDDLKAGYAIAYVVNINDDWCSEAGSIALRSKNGGVVRVFQ